MRRRLPPLFSLQVFEAAARLGTFSRAARELHLTQGAVSRQIRQLESWTGRTLFRRNGPRVEITEAGESLLARLAGPLEALHGAIYADEDAQHHTLHVATLVSIVRAVLLPQLAAFTRAHPQLQVSMHTDYALASLPPRLPVVALRFCGTAPPDLAGELLFGDRLVVVATPAVAAELRPSPALWPSHRMLRHTAQDWTPWLAAAQADLEPAGLTFNDAAMMLEAAEGGAGIALSRLTLAWEALHAGRLQMISPLRVVSPRNHHLLWRPESLSLRGVAAFRGWMHEEAALWRERLAGFDRRGPEAWP